MGLAHGASLSLTLACLAACGAKTGLDFEPGDSSVSAGLGGAGGGRAPEINGGGGIVVQADGSVGSAGAIVDASFADRRSRDVISLADSSPPDAMAPDATTREAGADARDAAVCDSPCPTPPTWLLGFGDDAEQTAATIAVLPDGASYIAGSFAGDVDFGDRVISSAGGGTNAFVAKFEPRGAIAWSKGFGDPGYQQFQSAAVDEVGGVAFTGQFGGEIDLGGGTLTSAGGYDLIIGHLDPSGAYVSGHRYGNPGNQYGSAVAVAPGNKIVAAGFFNGDLDPTVGIPSAGSVDAFLFEFSSGADRILAKSFGNALPQRASGLAVHPNGIAMVGDFDGIIDFGAGNLVTKGGRDVFIVYFDSTGTVRFHGRYGAPGDQIALAVAIDPTSEDIAVVGSFAGVIDFGCGTLTSAGGNDAFVAAFDRLGNCMLSRRFGDGGEQVARAVTFDAMHHLVVVGSFEGTLDIGSMPASAGLEDAFVLTLSQSGTVASLRVLGGAGSQIANSVGTDAASNVYVVGTFSNEIALGNQRLTSQGANDIFFAKLGP